MRKTIAAHILATFVTTASITAVWASPAPDSPTVKAVAVEKPPLLDGVLDDPCWEQATLIAGFFDLDTGGPASEATTAYLCYDHDNIYVAFRCQDSRPREIHASQRKRGAGLRNDDRVAIRIDTYGGTTQTYSFRANPIGTQQERIPGGAGPNIEWRGDWSCGARIVEDGWNCEMAIPFAILRYMKGTDTFAVALSRRLARQQKQFSWPNLGSTDDMHLAARWTGLKLPVFKPRPLVMPYFSFQVDQDAALTTQGADVKHQPAPGVTALLTLNPDFKNVQQQVEGIDFTYTERYVGDSRPFFMEGRPPSSLIWYTRTIPQIDLGAKVYGTLANTNFDLTHVRDFATRDDTMLNCYQFFNQGYSGVSAVLVNRHEPAVLNNNNTVAGAGLTLGQRVGREGSENLNLSVRKSNTLGLGGDGSYWNVSANRWLGEGKVSSSVSYEDVGAEFNPVDGFLPELDRDVRSQSGSLSYYDRVDRRYLREWNWSAAWHRQERHDGSLYTVGGGVSLGAEMQDNSSYSVGMTNEHRPLDEDRPLNKDRLWSFGGGWNGDQLYRRGDASFITGRLAGAHYLFTSFSQRFYLGGAASLQFRASTSRLKYPDRVEEASLLIATFNKDLSAYKNISGRLVSRAGKNNLYASYRQSLRRGMDLYVILGDPNAEQSKARLAVKALWVY